MIIRLNGKKYRIWFYKESCLGERFDVKTFIKKEGLLLKTQKRFVTVWETTCIIDQLSDIGGVNHWVQVGRGVAKQSPMDKYNKQIGRKISLRRAIDFASINGHYFTKSDRTVIWHMFKEQFGGFC